MQTVKDTIEALIEESYLLTLSEQGLNDALVRFILTCKTVIRETVRDMNRRRRLLRRIGSLHAAMPGCDVDSRHFLHILSRKPAGKHLRREEKVKRVAEVKLAILKAIEESEPQLVCFIEHDSSQPFLASPLIHPSGRTGRIHLRQGWMPFCIGCSAVCILMLVLYFLLKV